MEREALNQCKGTKNLFWPDARQNHCGKELQEMEEKPKYGSRDESLKERIEGLKKSLKKSEKEIRKYENKIKSTSLADW